jgi:predicted aldo/keto reductase-like oxidoreductase
MIYRALGGTGMRVSALGFGCMRFPRNLTQIDINRTEPLIVKAIQEGINYFDTAYAYGGSEEALGAILAKNNLRNKIFLATKLPIGKCKTCDDFETLFQTQLERLHTDYIDYYLIHNIGDTREWQRLGELGIEKWIFGKKESGQIKNIGFSFHGAHDEFLKLLDIYDWDFCQIQYNYINTNYQAGTAGLKKAADKGLSVIIMEPLLGGKLATGLPRKAVDIFMAANRSLTPAAWGLRWLWNQKEVTVVISGMNEMSQVEDNIQTAQSAVPDMLTAAENEAYESVIKIIEASYKIPCTGCNYCIPCPQNVNIPACFAAYNVSHITGMISGIQQYVTSTALLNPRKNYAASNCIECGACEKKCPQHIPIAKSLKQVTKKMEPFWLRAGLNIYMKVSSSAKVSKFKDLVLS